MTLDDREWGARIDMLYQAESGSIDSAVFVHEKDWGHEL